MAVDKLVDSTQLDADLTTVADAIRTKGGTSAALAFPAGFVDAIDAIETGGGGGGDFKLLIDAPVKTTSKWNTPSMQNTLSSDGVIEVIFTDSAPTTDYGNIFSIGLVGQLATFASTSAVHFYHSYSLDDGRDFIVIRYNKTGTSVEIDSSSPVTIRIADGYICVNGEQALAVPATIEGLASIAIGSMEGTKRFSGIYSKISYK